MIGGRQSVQWMLLFILLLSAAWSTLVASDIDQRVDELFIKASSGEVQYRDLVEPSKEELIEMGIDAVPRLITKLSSEDARERHTLADIFKGIGSSAVPALVKALDTDNLYTLRNAARCLGEIGDKRATHALLPLFFHENHSVRSTAVTSVGKCHDSSAVDKCILLLGDTVETVRKSASVALGRIEDARAVSSLIDALEDVHFSVRMSAVKSLTVIGEVACDDLIDRYDTLSDLAKYLAFDIWAGNKYKPARKILERETKSEDRYLRSFAIYALASIDGGKALKRIGKMLKTETDIFVISRLHATQKLLESSKK